MIPPRIKRGEPVGKLVDYWNALIDHLNEIRLVPGQGVSISKMPAGTVINVLNYVKTAVSGQVSNPIKATEYEGYFCVSPLDRDEDDKTKQQLKVRVYDSGNKLSDNWAGYAIINSTSYLVASASGLLLTSAVPYIVLRFDVQNKKCSLEARANINNDLPWFYDYIIGELIETDGGEYRLQQRHNAVNGNGTIQFWTASNVCSWEYKDE